MKQIAIYFILTVVVIAGCHSALFKHPIKEHRHRILHDRYYDRHDEGINPVVKDQKEQKERLK